MIDSERFKKRNSEKEILGTNQPGQLFDMSDLLLEEPVRPKAYSHYEPERHQCRLLW